MESLNEPVATVSAKIDRTISAHIKTDSHSFISDEPVTIGGTDAGPSPQELLLASIGSCTAITLRIYIDRKMWVVENIKVNVELFEVEGATLIKLQLSF